MTDQKNTILAIVLSALVLVAWQYFVGMPQMEKQRQAAQQQQAQKQQQTPAAPGTPVPAPGTPGAPAPTAGAPAQPGVAPAGAPQAPGTAVPGGQVFTRAAVLAASPRVAVETPLMKGSIALKGGRIDDLALTQYRETVDPSSPAIVLLSPSGTEHPFYAEFGWVPGRRRHRKAAGRRHGVAPGGRGRAHAGQAGDAGVGQWRRARIPPHHRGRRQVPVHRASDEVANKGAAPVTLLPLCADLAPRHAEDRRLLHPARRPDRRARRGGAEGGELQGHRGQEVRSRSR